MKAFLMYRDRDLDTGQILSAENWDVRSRESEREARLKSLLPWNATALPKSSIFITVLVRAGGLPGWSRRRGASDQKSRGTGSPRSGRAWARRR